MNKRRSTFHIDMQLYMYIYIYIIDIHRSSSKWVSSNGWQKTKERQIVFLTRR